MVFSSNHFGLGIAAVFVFLQKVSLSGSLKKKSTQPQTVLYSKPKLIREFFKRHPYQVALALFLGFMANVLLLLLPISLGKYFDLLFGYESTRAHFLDVLPFSFWDDIPEFILFFLIATSLWLITNFAYRFFTADLGLKFTHELRVRLFERQMFIPLEEYELKGYGKYLLRYSGDLTSIRNYLVRGILRFVIDLALILLAMLGLYHLNSKILLGLLPGFALTLLAVFLLNKVLYKRSVKMRNKRSGLLAYVSQRLQAMDTIQAFNRYVPEEKRFEQKSETAYIASRRYQGIYQLVFTLVPVMLYWTLALTLYVFAIEGEVSELQHGNLVAFVLLFITVLPIFRRVIRVGTVWKVGDISFQKLIRVLELGRPETVPDVAYVFKKGHIVLKNVDFSYLKGKPVLHDVSMDIAPGAITFLKWRTGSGKTTLIKLLLALYYPSGGEILVDGQRVTQLNPKSLRKYITVVSNEFPLLGKTVFEAISYSRKRSKRARAEEVLSFLQADLPEEKCLHLDDRIGELGSRLSKGQEKMLFYARAMLSNKPIVLIEDPFKNMSSAVRKQVLEWLESNRKKKTILLLASSSQLYGLQPDFCFPLKTASS